MVDVPRSDPAAHAETREAQRFAGARQSAARDRERLAFAYAALDALVREVGPRLKGEQSASSGGASGQSLPTPAAAENHQRSVLRASGATSGEQASAPRRLSVEMQAGPLGKVSLSIEMGPKGLDIDIAIEDSNAARLAAMERKNLVSALKSQGVALANVRISGFRETGIALAPAFDAARMRSLKESSERSNQAYRQRGSKEDIKQRYEKRLKLIG